MTVRTIGSVASAFLGKVEDRKAQGGVDLLGLSTGLPLIDDLTGGMGPDEMWTVGGVTGTGKSAIAMDITLAVIRQGKGSIYYSLEMSAESLTNRLLSRMTQVPAGRIIRGKLSNTEYQAVANAVEEISDLDLVIIDESLTSEDILRRTEEIASKLDIGFVTVDYCQLLGDPNEFGEVERVGRISHNVRTLARPDHLNAPVLMLSQLNRASQSREDQVPALHDLKSASDIEQDSHCVLLLHRPYQQKTIRGAPSVDVEKDAQIILAKNRNGMAPLTTRAEFHTKTMSWSQDFARKAA